ncbi:MAG: FAD-dependent oxidoreductase [Sphaerochaeta sp.]|uniref:phytoene desaturase family protein n=1 Tax=Sphaerochaeta sp. TaxID=1972642 RepID=UPI00258A0F8D|nr:FAD-dependent oxidoreductase [Sphaerochaeta sp.]MDD4036918.1 FAD-dependent oxidoreductase [Sphaerochaeta sp.]
MHFDVIVIGSGLSGLSAASLLAKRGLTIATIDKSYCPGGSCGAFKRGDAIFDQGSSMLFGWGEKGFNAHRFLFNCLEEPITIIQHDLLYCVHYDGKKVNFYPSIAQFIDEVATLFPGQRDNLVRFYADMQSMYEHVMVENPSYTTPDEVDKKAALKSLLRHPFSYIRFLSYMNVSAKALLSKYFTDEAIFNFFDKLTSTYCYATVEESPAILASVMFVDNHAGGSYYPAGSTLQLTGALEKVIEEHGSTMIAEREVVSILFEHGRPNGVLLDDGTVHTADQIIYSGTVWNLYGKLLPHVETTEQQRSWAENQEPTYPSIVLYTLVDKEAVDDGTLAVEMLVGRPDALDEEEVTAYIPSVDDKTLCADDEHIVLAIGPSFGDWASLDPDAYRQRKERETKRLLGVLAKRFPTIKEHLRHAELATPRTIERFTMKNGGAVAGPKQKLGNHMFKRQHIRTAWDTLFCCGESTMMGTGTPTVTTSGIAAANAVLSKRGLEPYLYQPDRKEYVHLIKAPFTSDQLYASSNAQQREVQLLARRCQLCEHPSCSQGTDLDVRGIMRRVTVGNFVGAKRKFGESSVQNPETLEPNCIREEKVAIGKVCEYLKDC